MTEPVREFVTLDDAYTITSIPVRTLRLWIAQGRLAAFRPGKRVLVRRTDLMELVEGSR